MARLIFVNLLLLTIYSILLHGSKRYVHRVYKPYGPKMCRKVCADLTDSFLYLKEDLSCRWIVSVSPGGLRNHSPEDSFFCYKNNTRKNISTSLKDPTLSYSGDKYSKDDPKDELTTTPPSCNDDLQIDKNITLHRACHKGDLCVVQYILSRGLEDINSREYSGRTPVMIAAQMGHRAVFDLLLSYKCDLSSTDVNANNVLHLACQGGNTDIVRTLIFNEKFDMDAKGWREITPVMCAAWYGQRSVFDFLVSQNCDLSANAPPNENVLHFAAKGGNVGIVQTLIVDKKIQYDDRGWEGWTPVMCAACCGHGEVFHFLVSKGCDLSRTEKFNNSILHLACIGGNVEIVKTLIVKQRFDIEAKGRRGKTPILTAVSNGRQEVFDLLVEKGCNLYAKDNKQTNILHYACLGGQVSIVNYVISRNISDLESRDRFESTPLMKAVLKGHVKVLDLLLKRGCRPTVHNAHGNNILHLACGEGFVDMVNYILEKDIIDIEERNEKGNTPLLRAATRGHKEVFEALVRKGCNTSVTNYKGNNVLHSACEGGHVGIVKHILKHYVVSIESRNHRHSTPVLIAAALGYTRVVEVLVSNGCNQSAQDGQRNNILHVASIEGHLEMAKYILTVKPVGADSRGFIGRTAVMQAAMFGQIKIVELLLSKGCNPKTSDDQGNNMLHLACVYGEYKIVKYILNKHIVGIDSRGRNDRTPVMYVVCKKKNIKILKLLVDRGCDLKAVDNRGNSPLHMACTRDHKDMVRYMIGHGDVDYKQKNKHGRTPLQVAEAKHLTAMIFLLKAAEQNN